MEKGLLEKTGKPLSHWIGIVEKSKIVKHKAIIDFLKAEHGFTYGFANFVAHKSRQSDAESHDDDQLLIDQYKGKESLKPIHDKLIDEINKFGIDITNTPKRAAVSLIRKRQFALIKPATKTRIDLGLKIKNRDFEGRLQNSGPFGSMCTHSVQLNSVEEVDREVIGWIKEAYEQSV